MTITQKRDFCTRKLLLGRFAELRTGYSFREKLREEHDGDLAVIQMKDIDESSLLHPERLVRIRMPELLDRHMVSIGDLLFCSRGRSFMASLVGADLGRAVLAAPMMIIRPQTTEVEPAYLQWFINHPETQQAIANRAAGSAVKMISKAELERFEIPLPPIDVQRRIVDIGHLVADEARLSADLLRRRKLLMERILISIVEGPGRSKGEKRHE